MQNTEAGGTPTVLVVDDNEANLIALRASLEGLHANVICVNSGFEALRELLQRDISVVVLDVQMPGMNGLEVAQAMRTRERTRHVPIIFVTAISRETAWVMKGYETGAVDYLFKPVEPTILAAKVNVFIELWRRGKLLEQRAFELARARAAEEEAKRAAQLEQELMAIVGHDIRSPLTAIAGTGAILRKRFDADAVTARQLDRILASGRRLDELSALLLDYARARTGRGIPVELKIADVAALCREVADEVAYHWPDSRILTTADEALLGCVDAARLRQLLTNLIENAAKHGTEAEVSVTLQRRGCGLELAVHNGGAPISESALARLFEPFARGSDAKSPASPSVGLGLYIVKVIAQAHGGQVTVQSSAEEGTTFRVLLPRALELSAHDGDCPPLQASGQL